MKTKECRKKNCPFLVLENSRPLSPPQGPQISVSSLGTPDCLSSCLGTDSVGQSDRTHTTISRGLTSQATSGRTSWVGRGRHLLVTVCAYGMSRREAPASQRATPPRLCARSVGDGRPPRRCCQQRPAAWPSQGAVLGRLSKCAPRAQEAWCVVGTWVSHFSP